MLFSRHCACHEGCHGSRGQDRRSQAAAAGARTEAWPTARDPGWRRTAGDRDRFHSDAAEEAGQGAGGGTGSQAASAHGRASPRHAGARTAVKAADPRLVRAPFRALAKLLKRRKRTAEPVAIAHRKRQLTTTFWGKAWADNLERYADLANRLPRGRAYLRNGSVLDLAIAGGRVEAYVAGSELYRVTIGIAPVAKTRWRRVVRRCTGRIGSLVGLLRGELSDDVLAVLTHPEDGPFPDPRRLTLDCSCPDSAEVCKHV